MALNPDQEAWVENLLQAFADNGSKVSKWENEFLTDQVDRWSKYGADIRFSERQWAILDRVAEKYNLPKRGQERPEPPAGWDEPPGMKDEIPF